MKVELNPDELRAISYLRDLPAPALARFAEAVQLLSFSPSQFVIHEGDECTGLFYVRSGRVRIFKTSLAGKEQVLHYSGPGSTFNDVPVFDQGPNPASVTALEPTELLFISCSDLRALIGSEPTVAQAVARSLAMRIRHLVGLVEDLSFRHVTNRVAKILLEHYSSPDAPKLTQQEMAALAGTAREMVARVLKILEVEGAIKIDHGKVKIANRDKLETLV